MFYQISRSVPANTAQASPDWQKLQLTKGNIVEWTIFMPYEAANLLHFQVSYHNQQILPFTNGESIFGFFIPTVLKESIKLDTPPYELDILAWNTDTNYEHMYILGVNIIPAEPVIVGDDTSERIRAFFDKFMGV